VPAELLSSRACLERPEPAASRFLPGVSGPPGRRNCITGVQFAATIAGDLGVLAAPVDRVVGEQLTRLVSHVTSTN
jgi:hypothetical protein